MQTQTSELSGHIVNEQFILDKKIGHGSFGDVYSGYNNKTNEPVAIKMEHLTRKHVLKHEHEVYMALSAHRNCPAIPKIFWFGDFELDKQVYRVMVMQNLGCSLQHYHHRVCSGQFSLKTTLMVGIQLLDLLTLIHSCGYIHRDIKPENFLLGTGNDSRKIYAIDFGLAKRFKSFSNVHIVESSGRKLVGTARYTSINSHKGMELSRRDDLESLSYLLVYFYKGVLPWQDVNVNDRIKKYQEIGRIKEETSTETLCQGMPKEIVQFVNYIKVLNFRQRPDYTLLRRLLTNCFSRHNFIYDYFDWQELKNDFSRLVK
jgi:serine/threonine protein kinase